MASSLGSIKASRMAAFAVRDDMRNRLPAPGNALANAVATEPGIMASANFTCCPPCKRSRTSKADTT
eukprot:scaffold768_cov355-Pinguiococcus_pyrenoidosus.AAC.1